MRLPEHLELLVSDEPVLDFYAAGPWRVPDGLFDQIRDRIDALAADPRSVPLTTDHHALMANPAPLVVAEMMTLFGFLQGAATVLSGSSTKLFHEVFGRLLTEPLDPQQDSVDWSAGSGAFRPFDWLEESGDQDLSLTLAREALTVFEGLEPIEARRQALVKLFETPPPGRVALATAGGKARSVGRPGGRRDDRGPARTGRPHRLPGMGVLGAPSRTRAPAQRRPA
ncbi:hypothetical protein [Actinomadura madurae]|uniref:hypothetical protein n=1 Tax=Actinomadura madurae TaxID=1993 RepID=UPI0020D21CB7|nr:hypothetical protein [Actinomadura madurae]MCQ0018835.1 hypothetical protein [Actinomadura madurae]